MCIYWLNANISPPNVTKSNANLIDEYFTINLSTGSERALKE